MKTFAILIGVCGFAATGSMAQTTPQPAPTNPPADTLADKLINQVDTNWTVYGSGQTNQRIGKGAPHGYDAIRVNVPAKGVNPWDVGAVAPLVKPISAGDTVVVAIYLRAPMLKDGETASIPFFGLSVASPPYDFIAKGSATLTNQWKVYTAAGKATASFAPNAVAVGIHLAGDKHVIDLGPVRVLDLGPNVDPAQLSSGS